MYLAESSKLSTESEPLEGREVEAGGCFDAASLRVVNVR